MQISDYLNQIAKRYASGISKEHSYRGDLESLLRNLTTGIEITNEPTNVTDCGNPDYVLTKDNIPVGYIEAKDIGKDLNSKQYNEQFFRYKSALDNLIITDYLWFKFYKQGELVYEVRIGTIEGSKITPLNENFNHFKDLILEFVAYSGQTIKSPKKLAEMMAGKARLLQSILANAIVSDEKTRENTSLKDQYESFRRILINDLTPEEFADIYAQTLAYGMFAARLHDTSLEGFDRKEAAELIPKTNPFLRKLFQYVAGYDIDERIITTVDNLADVFRATDVKAILNNFGKSTQTTDPIIHFYETFLSSFDPDLRKARGVYYTPEPVVKYIVKAVDYILKKDFSLGRGLADTAKTKIKKEIVGLTKGTRKRKAVYEELEVHKVQILDPATGTGTFLAETIRYIYTHNFQSIQGAWGQYVEDNLIPRIYGFELLMASYSMAHLKLDMLLMETGYEAKKNQDQRFNVYLTNTLEEHHPDTGTLFANWLSSEANEANYVKRDSPIMVVMGNPPYSVSSSNKGDWIQKLLTTYKKGLDEKKINLDDDYIKFIRYGHYFIEKNGEGVLAYISSNSFLGGVTHRKMREQLMETFDKIYILDLHGNSKQKETAPDGSIDQNVFDIGQGVSINIFIKKKQKNAKKQKAIVYHKDLYGYRNDKYDFLNSQTIHTVEWKKLQPIEPYFFFTDNSMHNNTNYEDGFSVEDLFIEKNTGIQTKNDKMTIHFTRNEIEEILQDLKSLDVNQLRTKYGVKDGTWTIENAKKDILAENYAVVPILFKPFDVRYTALTQKSGGFLGRPRYRTMKHMLLEQNVGLLVSRQNKSNTIDSFLVSKYVSEMKCAERTIQSYHLPLYVKDEESLFSESKRLPNLNLELIRKISEMLNLEFSPEKELDQKTFAPIDLLDYIYAILYSNKYRKKYIEYMKIDFPRIPYPNDNEKFWELVKLGSELREVHLMDKLYEGAVQTKYPIDGDNKITNKIVKKNWEITNESLRLGRIWINEHQYFDNISEELWGFYIGGYQPAQKWLKDRVGKKLDYEEILHYQFLIEALKATGDIMKRIDDVIILD